MSPDSIERREPRERDVETDVVPDSPERRASAPGRPARRMGTVILVFGLIAIAANLISLEVAGRYFRRWIITGPVMLAFGLTAYLIPGKPMESNSDASPLKRFSSVLKNLTPTQRLAWFASIPLGAGLGFGFRALFVG